MAYFFFWIHVFVFIMCSGAFAAAEPTYQSMSIRLSALETELCMLKNNISTQEQAREALEKEVSKLLTSAKEVVHDSAEQSANRQKSFERTVEKLTSDLKQVKAHANELSQTINDLSHTVSSIKETTSTQALALKELEQALRGLTIALQGKVKGGNAEATHVVQSGESLEKIARKYGTTIAHLKEINHLASTKIHPGQELLVASK